jgi:hypothetical protein
MTDFTRYFAPGVKNTLFLKNGVNFYNRGPWRQVYDDTEIDRWYVGDFTAAQYIISVEYNSQKKETMSVLVVARPDQASYSISGRASIDDPLITISATVNDSYLSLKLSPIIPAYAGVRVIYFAQYFATLTDLDRPIPLSYLVPQDSIGDGSGGGSIPTPGDGGSSGNADLSAIDRSLTPTITGTYDVGISLKRFRDLYLKNTINLDGAIISKNLNGGIELPIGSTVDGNGLVSFGTISVAGEPDIESISLNDTLTLIAGAGMTITSNPSARTITLTSSGGGGDGGATAANAFGVISVSGQSTIRADTAADTLTFVAGAGISITTNSTSDRITITNTGTGGGGGGTSGTASEIIVTEILEGIFPMVIAEGTDPLTGQSLYASSGVTLEVATSTLNVTATTARWADLAEKYLADQAYEPGTVLEFGGDKEVTMAQDGSKRIAGIVSTDPAFVMNNDLSGDTVIRLALQGRVPCKVRGKIRKGDMLISGGSGYARPSSDPSIGTVIGKALENFDGVEGIIEVVVGRL